MHYMKFLDLLVHMKTCYQTLITIQDEYKTGFPRGLPD